MRTGIQNAGKAGRHFTPATPAVHPQEVSRWTVARSSAIDVLHARSMGEVVWVQPRQPHILDAELFVDMLVVGVRFERTSDVLASFRIYDESITGSKRSPTIIKAETLTLRRKLLDAGFEASPWLVRFPQWSVGGSGHSTACCRPSRGLAHSDQDREQSGAHGTAQASLWICRESPLRSDVSRWSSPR